jgi:hypothetical protein
VQAIELLRENAAPRQPEDLRAFDADEVEEPRQTMRPMYQRTSLLGIPVGHGMSVHLGASQLSVGHVSMIPPSGAQREFL